MHAQRVPGTPSLVVTSPGGDLGRRIVLAHKDLTVGRAETCDIRLDDPRVSRRHAVLRSHRGAVYVDDANSAAGTFVNGERVTSPRQLRPGDVIALATVRFQFEVAGPGDETQVDGFTPFGHPERPAAGGVRYDVDRQVADSINNVGRDQVIQMIQERDDFLRQIAATKTKARYLIILGFGLVVVGFAMFAGGVLSFLSNIAEFDATSTPSELPTPFGQEVFGVPSGLLGWALSAAGMFLMVVGGVLHVVATSRRKRVDREHPDPRWSPRYH